MEFDEIGKYQFCVEKEKNDPRSLSNLKNSHQKKSKYLKKPLVRKLHPHQT